MLNKSTTYQPLYLNDDSVIDVSDVIEAQYRYDDEANKLHCLRELHPVNPAKEHRLASYFKY